MCLFAHVLTNSYITQKLVKVILPKEIFFSSNTLLVNLLTWSYFSKNFFYPLFSLHVIP